MIVSYNDIAVHLIEYQIYDCSDTLLQNCKVVSQIYRLGAVLQVLQKELLVAYAQLEY